MGKVFIFFFFIDIRTIGLVLEKYNQNVTMFTHIIEKSNVKLQSNVKLAVSNPKSNVKLAVSNTAEAMDITCVWRASYFQAENVYGCLS